jgi:hypothetical protein
MVTAFFIAIFAAAERAYCFTIESAALSIILSAQLSYFNSYFPIYRISLNPPQA